MSGRKGKRFHTVGRRGRPRDNVTRRRYNTRRDPIDVVELDSDSDSIEELTVQRNRRNEDIPIIDIAGEMENVQNARRGQNQDNREVPVPIVIDDDETDDDDDGDLEIVYAYISPEIEIIENVEPEPGPSRRSECINVEDTARRTRAFLKENVFEVSDDEVDNGTDPNVGNNFQLESEAPSVQQHHLLVSSTNNCSPCNISKEAETAKWKNRIVPRSSIEDTTSLDTEIIDLNATEHQVQVVSSTTSSNLLSPSKTTDENLSVVATASDDVWNSEEYSDSETRSDFASEMPSVDFVATPANQRDTNSKYENYYHGDDESLIDWEINHAQTTERTHGSQTSVVEYRDVWNKLEENVFNSQEAEETGINNFFCDQNPAAQTVDVGHDQEPVFSSNGLVASFSNIDIDFIQPATFSNDDNDQAPSNSDADGDEQTLNSGKSCEEPATTEKSLVPPRPEPAPGSGNESNEIETRLVYYPNPDLSKLLTKNERQRLKNQIYERLLQLQPVIQLGEKYKRQYPTFPPSPDPEDPYPRNFLKKDKDGVVRRVVLRSEDCRADDEAEIAAGNCNYKLPTLPTPSFLQIVEAALPKGSIQSRVGSDRSPCLNRNSQGSIANEIDNQKPEDSEKAELYRN